MPLLHEVFRCNSNMAAKPTETDEQRIEKAEDYKAEGNEFFKNTEFKSAMRRYHYALMYLKGIGDKHPITGHQNILTDEWQRRHDEIKFGCFNNLAACLIKEQKWEKVIDYCDKALQLRPENVKALFRKGQACYHMKDWDKAFESILQARKIEPNDANIKKYQIKLEQELKKYREKQKAVYAGMFSK